MIPKVGVDLVPIGRVNQLLAPERRAVLGRMLAPAEIASCTRSGAVDALSVAGRLAAKEAVFKLFDAGPAVLPWLGIRLSGGVDRTPGVRLIGSARALADRAGLGSDVSISISHDGDYAIAVAAAISDL